MSNNKTIRHRSKSAILREKKDYLISMGNGFHRWEGALYEVKGSKYRQMYSESNPASNWREL